jgi:exodeoxyribonuclease VII large subunit
VRAVGHERDHTISDEVADVRAPTPSAAAELVVPDAAGLALELQGYRSGLARALSHQVQSRRLETEGLARDLRRHAPDLDTMRRRVDDLARATDAALAGRLSRWKAMANGHHLSLQALNPRSILYRGYAIVEKQPEGAVVLTRAQVTAGEELKVTVTDGSFQATAGAAHNRKRRGKDPITAGARLL